MNPYGTHEIILRKALSKSGGPVLECGVGATSTPLLHILCTRITRLVVSYESERAWIDRFAELQDQYHQFRLVSPGPAGGGPDWCSVDYHEHRWGVVLVDQSPAASRLIPISACAEISDYIVIHDTESPGYHYERLLSTFPYRFTWKRLVPWTTVVSCHHPIQPEEWDIAP